jgi:hypothetical protein
MSNLEVILWLLISTLAVVLFVSIFNIINNWRLIRSVTSRSRGTKSERALVLKLLKLGLPAQDIFHDLFLRKVDGKFSQIDVVAITKVGIIVFEVKDYSGWIFGSGYNNQWTKVLAYGKQKYRFYNPIKQNSSHIDSLRKKLKYHDEVRFFSVVVFYGNCVLKDINYVPEGTFITKSYRIKSVLNHILKSNHSVNYKDKESIITILNQAKINGDNRANLTRHNENIKDLLGKHRIFD